MNIEDLYDDYSNYLRAEKDVSELTVNSYSNDFNLFIYFLYNNKLSREINDISTAVIRRYVTFLKIEKEFQVRTIRRKIYSLSSFFKYLTEMEFIYRNPMTAIHAPKKPDILPIFITEDDLKKLLSAPMKYKSQHTLRDQAILYTLIYTGVRRAELLSLNIDAINLNDNTLLVKKGKGKKQRIIPILPSLSDILWTYLQSRLPISNNALFLSDVGNRLSSSSLQNIFTKYLKLTSLTKKNYTIHKCRHAFSTLLYRNSCDLISLMTLLGHKDLNTTKIYTHLDTSHIKDEMKKFPPLL